MFQIGTAYPGRTLEIIIRTTRPPVIYFHQGKLTSYSVLMKLCNRRLTITKLNFDRGVEFFGLSDDDLGGLRKTTKTAIENMTNAVLTAGIHLQAPSLDQALRLSATHVSIAPGLLLLQANVDLYSSFYNRN
ncbi:hypothetical protein COOONC_25279 [Cooperia oncophora]